MALNFDGKTLATIVKSDTAMHAIQLWDMNSVRWDMYNVPQPMSSVTLTGHNDDIKAVTLSRNGHLLATVSRDEVVRIWDLDPNSVAKRYCRIIGVASEEQKRRWESVTSVGFPVDPICG